MLPGLEQRHDFGLGSWKLSYYPRFLARQQADQLFAQLLNRDGWGQPQVHIHGKDINVPRLVAWEGDKGVHYSYSGLTHTCRGWSAQLDLLKQALKQQTGYSFNFVLLNLYRDGQDAMGWHRDNERELGPNPIVASISLGAERDFHLRERPGARFHNIKLEHGSLLLMPGGIMHQLPRRAAVASPRINISFRQVQTNTNQNVNHC